MIYAGVVLLAISIVALFVAFALFRCGNEIPTPQQPTPEQREWAFHRGKVAGRRTV